MHAWKPTRAVLLLAALLTATALMPASADSSYREPKRVSVMTLNMYLGADIYPVFTALKHPPLLPGVVARVWGHFLGTNIDERVEAMARLIRVARPDLIGLQEAVLVRTQAPSAPTPASRVAYDFRDLLLAALTKSRLDYRPVAQSENLDIELPADLDGIPTDIRVTDRDVILARGDVEIGEITKRNYRHSVSLPGSVSLLRGFVAVDAIVRGNAYRFVSTHLEPGMFAPPTENIRVEQVNELIGALDELDRKKPLPVFVVGDFNSQATYGDAYLRMTRAGYEDVWTGRVGAPVNEFTCCQDSDLLNQDSLLRDRIDLIFTKNVGFRRIVARTGLDRPRQKTPSGLWPSDHAAVFAYLWGSERLSAR